MSAVIEADETTELLIQARGLVERGWCRDAAALDADGIPVPPTARAAVRWCMSGALVAASGRYAMLHAHRARCRLEAVVGNVGKFNDDQKAVEPVLAAFDRAIAVGRGRGMLRNPLATFLLGVGLGIIVGGGIGIVALIGWLVAQ